MNEIIAKVVALIILVTLLLTIFFCLPVFFHYFGKWDDYWNTPAESSYTSEATTTTQAIDYSVYRAATDDCTARAAKYFNLTTSSVVVYADTQDEYKHYTCYGLGLKKIPQ